ncbi:unknown protein [Seminavis robusta]|uniref:Uncharacterized protein n=1 Tax=Seminavis robusta TaxID=568900 RepID=A0A9N8HBJ3_9STRA|nr:unknown protein [Seminavis robusta]|eukprot:Sro185_g080200.1 n/a (507) ;mRNA; r:8479-10082
MPDPPERDVFDDLPIEAIEAADELIAEYLESCEHKEKESPPASFLKGEYQSPTGILTSPMKSTRFSDAVLEHCIPQGVGDNRKTQPKISGEKAVKKGVSSDPKRKLPPREPTGVSPASTASSSPPSKRSSVPQGDGYVQNGTAFRKGARVKKPIPQDAVILSIDSDSDSDAETEDNKMPSFQDDRKPEAVKSGVTVKKEEETVYYKVGNTLIASGPEYRDSHLEAIKKQSRAAARAMMEENCMPKPPPPEGCSFLDAARHQTLGRTAESAAVVSRTTAKNVVNVDCHGVPPAMKNLSSANVNHLTARVAPTMACNLKPAGRTRRMSKRPVQADTASSSSESESDSESDESIELTEEEQERFDKLGAYGRQVYLGKIRESRRLREAGSKLKDRFAIYSKAPTYNGASKENKAPHNYLHAKKKEWKKKEAESKARKMLADEEKKKKKKKTKPRRSKSDGPTRKVGDFPEYWGSDSVFLARANGTAGVAGIHSALSEGQKNQPDTGFLH